jgi:hypothetical protein
VFCPQCGAQVGEGAKSCAACGWSSSRRTLWIVLGCVFGFLFLLCCGGGALVVSWGNKFGKQVQGTVAQIQVKVHRAQVVAFAKKEGRLPKDLAESAKAGFKVRQRNRPGRPPIHVDTGTNTSDTWGNPLTYRPAADGTFEIRSSGPDGKVDTADDVVEKGSGADDLDRLEAEISDMGERLGEEAVKSLPFGMGKRILEQMEAERKAREGAGPTSVEKEPGEKPPVEKPAETAPAVGTAGK